MHRRNVFREIDGKDIVGHSIFRKIHLGGLAPYFLRVDIPYFGDDRVPLETLIVVIDYRDSVLEIVELRVERLACIGRCIEGRCRLQRPVPHTSADLADGRVVIPVEEARCPAVTVAELVVVPYLPDALVVHRSDELGFHRELINAVGFSVHIHEIHIQSGHLVEAVAIAVVPYFPVDRPEILFRHHLAQTFHSREARSPVFRVEPVHAAAPVGGRVLIVAHRVDCLVRAAIVDSGTFGLHLVASCPVQFHYQVTDARHLGGLVGAYIVCKRWMVADTFDGGFHILEIQPSVYRMFCIPGHPEFSPYHYTEGVAQVVESVGFSDPSSPLADQVDP